MGSLTANSVPSRTPAWNSSPSTGFSLCPLICFLLATLIPAPLSSQTPANKPAPNSEAQQSAPSANSSLAETEKNPAQIELLETKYRFEANGDSRKEVHTRVRINNELGVRQFGRLNFDFNRSFQAIEIPLVHITHPSGGSADILPSAITDNPNPAVVDAPAYHDVRVKSVRILGLQPGDILEYRVITTTTRHPLAPDFWLDHTFDRSGVVSDESFDLDLPASRQVQMRINSQTPVSSTEKSGDGDSARLIYHWQRMEKENSDQSAASNGPDLALTTYESWLALSSKLSQLVEPPSTDLSPTIRTKAVSLTKEFQTSKAKLEALYDFVSAKIRTVDLSIGAMWFRTREPDEILQSGYGISEDKFALLASLAWSLKFETRIALFAETNLPHQLPRPSLFSGSLTLVHISAPPADLGRGRPAPCDHCGENYWLAPALEVAPFEMIPATLRGREAFVVNDMLDIRPFAKTPKDLPFSSLQDVTVKATISPDGTLNTKMRYVLRGDNEFLLRVAFHKTPKQKWKEVAQLLAISDGFRGQITNVTASDPYATRESFQVEYEITQPKFVDWSNKPVRIPALLPLPGLPDPASPSDGSTSAKRIDLGTPLDIALDATVQLPEGTSSQAPIGTSVERDYATFSSKYSAQGNTLHATRKLRFIAAQLPVTRATDLNAFLHAVQADQTQSFTLQRTQAAQK